MEHHQNISSCQQNFENQYENLDFLRKNDLEQKQKSKVRNNLYHLC